MKDIVVLGVGNILEMDDGVAVYATKYLQSNYTFTPAIKIINGGVEGINLLNLFMEHEHIIILDAIEIDDEPGSIYHIPSSELSGYGLNSGGAHEIGVLQCFDILELMGRELPQSSVLGIVPHIIDVRIDLSQTLKEQFPRYIKILLDILKKNKIAVEEKDKTISLEEIILTFMTASTL